MQPRKFDRVFLTIFFAAGFISLLIGLKSELPIWSNEIWRWVLAGTAACGVAAWYIVSVYLRSKVPSPAHPLRVSAETVMLWVLVGLCTAYGSWEAGKFAKRDFVKGGGGIGQPTLNIEPVWTFAPDIGGVVVNTCATPERLYAAVMVVEGLSGRFGRVYALDPATGKELWKFDNNYENDSKNGMKPAFSAPVFADGRLYFGEGLHTDNDSRLFCLDAATGNKLWEYKTESHTESTPFVAEGKVVIGAGYHGLHCLDAVKGPGPDNTPLWRYPPNAKAADKSMHVDSNPMIANGKVYGGSGYKPDYVSNDGKINTIFCLDLNTGKEVWPPERVDDAAYCSPLVHDGMVFYGTGNSTYNETIPSKRPGILCRDAATGKVIWDRVLPENVMARPAADRYQLYVGCLDGKAYTLDLKTGKIVRSIEAGGPVLASPIIEVDPQTGIASSLYVVGKHGLIVAVHPYTGNLFWSNSLSYWTQEAVDELSATPTFLRVADNDKEIRRHFYFGFGQGRTGSTVPRLLCIEDRSAKE
ncbi:MAG: PQQ-like beta-propeller repeat protein [Planctomycetes bacterium]|nr:PQQ-like beta-propeller repeat protein [Planctomycetota bacterium]